MRLDDKSEKAWDDQINHHPCNYRAVLDLAQGRNNLLRDGKEKLSYNSYLSLDCQKMDAEFNKKRIKLMLAECCDSSGKNSLGHILP